jgi:hypothetical protein
MSDFRVKPRALSSTTSRPRPSEQALLASGLPKGLFASSDVAFRRVDRVTSRNLEIEGGRVPRELVGEVKAGQWLRFERVEGGVQVTVDPEATQRGEERLMDLFQRLKR